MIIGFVKRHFGSILQVLAALIIGGYVMGAITTVRDFFFPESGAYIRSTRTILHGIQDIGQLVTVSTEVAKADIRVEVHDGFLNYGYYSASHVAVAAIEAGIDFAAISEENIRFDAANGSYHVTLPPPTLTSCRIEHIDQYDGSLTILPADWDVIRQLAQVDAINHFVQDLMENGILERAAEESALRMEDFISVLTGKQTVIKYQERDGNNYLPQSCLPDPPTGWHRKEGSNGWQKEG